MSSLNNFCRYCGAKLPQTEAPNVPCPACNQINALSSPVANAPTTRNISVLPKSFGMILVAICVLGIIMIGAITKFYASRSITLSTEIHELRSKGDAPQAVIDELEESRDTALNTYLHAAFLKTLVIIACLLTGFFGAFFMTCSQDSGERKLGFAAMLVLLLAAGHLLSLDLSYFDTLFPISNY